MIQSMNNIKTKSPPEIAAKLRVLVVDNNHAFVTTMGWMVELLGYDVRLASSGPEAIEIAKAFLPNIVLIDIGLPGMDGCEVCRIMREEPGLRQTVFIAQTGWEPEECKKYFSGTENFDHYMVKPVDIKVLEQVLTSVNQSRQS